MAPVTVPVTESGKIITIPAEGSAVGAPTTQSVFSYREYYVTPGATVTVTGRGGQGPRLWAFVDAENKVISRADASVSESAEAHTVPANSVRVIVNTNNGYSSEVIYTLPKNAKDEFARVDAEVEAGLLLKVDKTGGENIFTTENALAGKFINSDGGFANGGSYSITDFLKVEPSTSYFYSCAFNNNYPGGSGGINFYDEDRVLLSTDSTHARGFSTPQNCEYIRVTLYASQGYQYVMINKGTSRAQYAPFTPVGGYPARQSALLSARSSGSVAASGTLTGTGFPSNKSFIEVFEIKGEIEEIICGAGQGGAYGSAVKITPTQMITLRGATNTVANEYTHGLTLGTLTKVVISREGSDWINYTLYDDLGNSFSGRNKNTHIGLPYVTNNGSASLSASISQSSRDANTPIMVCGDSYWSLLDSARIADHLTEWGFDKYTLFARPGISAQEMLPFIQNFVGQGYKPHFIVWDLGMNGGTDSSNAVNSGWETATKAFIDVCVTHGITPILCTIPSLPSASHSALNFWVRASRFRYIDFASAVGYDVTTSGGVYWRGWGTDDALLSSDEVHPTEKGATMLAEQVLLDFPEIAILS